MQAPLLQRLPVAATFLVASLLFIVGETALGAIAFACALLAIVSARSSADGGKGAR